MGSLIILNGSPRAPRSNSRRYAEIVSRHYRGSVEYHNISRTNHIELCSKLENSSDLLLVFPLYADGIPVTLLNFLKTLEQNPPSSKPVISVLINCGFLEHRQNDIAVQMVELFCKQNGYKFGSVLKIGSGEAILDTPFKPLAIRKIKQLAASISHGRHRVLHTALPLSPEMFIRASQKYWINYGKRYGVTQKEMASLQIEPEKTRE